MTTQNLEKYTTNKHYDFWRNLKEGYDIFEKNHTLPKVNVKDKKYVFE